MAEYFNTWDDGEKKWIKKMGKLYREAEVKFDFDSILPVTLMSCDIKTNVVNESWIVRHANIDYKHYENHSINYWELKENIIILYFSDGPPFKLLFFSPGEAIKADFRLFLIMNGANIVNCDDADAYLCGNVLNVVVGFDMV